MGTEQKIDVPCYWSDYFENLLYRKMDSSLVAYNLFGDPWLQISMRKLNFILWSSLHHKAFKCQLNLTMCKFKVQCHKGYIFQNLCKFQDDDRRKTYQLKWMTQLQINL